MACGVVANEAEINEETSEGAIDCRFIQLDAPREHGTEMARRERRHIGFCGTEE